MRKIGTTGRGIGPAYEDRVARRAIRVADLAEPETLALKLDELLRHYNTLLRELGAETFTKEAMLAHLLALAPQILPYAEPVWERHGHAAQGRQAHPVRGRPGGDAGRGSRDLSVRDVVEHRRRDRRLRFRHRSLGGRLRAGDRQGLHDAGGLRPVPDRAARCDRAASGRPRARIRHRSPDGGGAAAGSTRRWCGRR